MKWLVFVLFGLILSLVSSPAFATTGGTSTNVKVTAEVVDENKMTITPVNEMRMPSVYKTYADTAYSNDQTNVTVGGLDGHDAQFAVSGPPGSYYGITFNETGALYDSNAHQLIIGYNFLDDYNEPRTSGSVCKHLGNQGSGELLIRGNIAFDGSQQSGAYNNYTNPLILTIEYDASYCR
jgi:hypothetical protein